MRKITLSIFLLFLALGTMVKAQVPTPVLMVTEIGSTPFKLSDEDAAKVFALESFTVAIDVTMGTNVTSRAAFVCASDSTKSTLTTATKNNTPYFAFGNKDGKLSYICSSRNGDQYSYGSITASAKHQIVFTVNRTGETNGLTNGRMETYINGTSADLKANFPWGGYELPVFSEIKKNHPNANIYIGGGVTSNGNIDLCGGTIHSVQFFNKALTASEVAAIYYPNETGITFEAEVEGLTESNPNTHFGGIAINIGTVNRKVTFTTMRDDTVVMADFTENVSLSFVRKYRGFDFVGFKLGDIDLGINPTLSPEQKALVVGGTPIVAKFKVDGTNDVTLFYDDDEFSYRIPAIAKTGTGRLVAISDYRHNLDDIGRDVHNTGKKRIDLVMRTSDDNGATWSDIKTIAAGNDSQVGSYLRAFGDAAVAAYGDTILVMAAAGDVLYTNGTTSNPNRMARIYSTDNGVNWTIEEMTTKMYSTSTSLIPSGGSAFFGSGKLAVDPNFNGTGKPRIYGALLVRIGTNGYNNFGVFSDDFGKNWKILGGSTNPIASGDEPKVEILPNGQILLSARRQGGRIFRVFTYGDDKASGAGSWGNASVNGCDNGGSICTNGEIICLDSKRLDGQATKILLQSQPKGGSSHYERYNVTIWYKEVSADETYTPSSIASGWTQGLEVSPAGVKSAYSAMTLQENGEVAFFFEEAPCYGDDHTKGYSMVYVPLTIEEITKNNYFSPATDLTTERNINVVLTDAQGNEYHTAVKSTLGGVKETVKAQYPYIEIGNNAELINAGDEFTYKNTVTLPFKVSNAEITVWHNIYYPTSNNNYPVYWKGDKNFDYVATKEYTSNAYGDSEANTLNGNNLISWAIYNVNNGFAFVFKNKDIDKYIKATSIADAANVVYVDNIEDATAFTISTKEQEGQTDKLGDYAVVAYIGEIKGYLSATSHSNGRLSHFEHARHQGAWVKIFESPDYDALIGEVNEMLENIAPWYGNGVGKYSFNEANTTLYETAKSEMPNSAGNVRLNKLNSYKNLQSAMTLNMPEDGKYYTFKNDDAYITSGVTSNDRIALSTTKDATAIYYYKGRHLLAYSTGLYIGLNSTDWTFETIGATDISAIEFVGAVNGTLGKYNIKSGGRWLHKDNGFVNRCSSNTCGNAHNWTIEEVESLPVTVTSAGYATFYTPVAVTVPDGVTAHTVTIDGEWAKLSEALTVIPANTGVVLAGEGSHDFAITTTENAVKSDLLGTVAATYITADAYVLGYINEEGTPAEVGFGKAATTGQAEGTFLNNSHKAYLPKPANSEGISFYGFRGDDEENTTAIENVETATVNVIYDLSGRRVETITAPGIYVVNGRKMLVK